MKLHWLLWIESDMIPRPPGFALVGSRRYTDCTALAFEVTTERELEAVEEYAGPLVDSPIYE